MVLKDGLKTALGGTLIGCVGAYWVGRSMQGMFPGVPSLDLPTFAAVALTLLAAAALACYVPARRAAAVDPADGAAGRVGSSRLRRGEPRRLPLAAGRVESGDAHRPAERDHAPAWGPGRLGTSPARRLGAASGRWLGTTGLLWLGSLPSVV